MNFQSILYCYCEKGDPSIVIARNVLYDEAISMIILGEGSAISMRLPRQKTPACAKTVADKPRNDGIKGEVL